MKTQQKIWIPIIGLFYLLRFRYMKERIDTYKNIRTFLHLEGICAMYQSNWIVFIVCVIYVLFFK
jgi:uncharacterized membrane protein